MVSKTNSKPKRGVILTDSGRAKLTLARDSWEQQHRNGKRLTMEELSALAQLSRNTIAKIFVRNRAVDSAKRTLRERDSLAQCFAAFGIVLTDRDWECQERFPQPLADRAIGDEAPDISLFYGRDRELQTLTDWIQIDRCRLVSIAGRNGIGKTATAAKLAQQLQPQFKTVCWRSLGNAPPLASLLPDLVRACSLDRDAVTVGSPISAQISQLLTHFTIEPQRRARR